MSVPAPAPAARPPAVPAAAIRTSIRTADRNDAFLPESNGGHFDPRSAGTVLGREITRSIFGTRRR